ncbi:ATP-binding cassette domain-containing protein [Reinekea marina]|uniref:ABC transporter ATP-binding protein n=1 Tax=Reinekea marina TaxID=1310421 RepID=A0ABV7WUV5_9GAMM|nr:ATP-binding cassette domain-containing protein [Reinekea marina]MDN3647530.1 ATP-binding cassette domain-containing protein [Reinekea marina]
MNATSTAITISNLSTGYGKKQILSGIHCSIKQGKLTALIGPNGCGKSTLLNSINGSLPYQEGDIALADGTLTQHLEAKARACKLSMLPQTPLSPEGVSVRQLVGYGRAPYLNFMGQMREHDHLKVEQALQQADVADLAEKSIAALSGGQRQRAWIAMVLAQDTDIILLDEPTTYLDVAHQFELLELLEELVQQQGKTIVVVLHDLHQACRFADELIIINEGRVFAQGEPSKVFTESMLSTVFDLNAQIIFDPQTGTPMAIPCKKGLRKVA